MYGGGGGGFIFCSIILIVFSSNDTPCDESGVASLFARDVDKKYDDHFNSATL